MHRSSTSWRLAFLLALGRFALSLAALDTRSAFTGMAASREMTFASLVEPTLLIALLGGAILGHGSGLGSLLGTGFGPASLLAFAAFFLVMLLETARIPLDNQETHYELTMMHEGLSLEYSGWHLALVSLGSYVRQLCFFVLAAVLLFPGTGLVVWIAAIVVLAVAVAVVETLFAEAAPVRGAASADDRVYPGGDERRAADLRGGRMTIELLAFLAGAGLLLDTSTARVVTAYAIIVGLVAFVVAPATLSTPLPLAFFAAAFVLKLIAAPIAIWAFVRRNAAARSLRPAFDLPLRLIVVLALAGASQLVPRVPGLASIPHAGMAAYIVLCGLAVLVLHRNLLAQVIGLLVLSTGVTLAGIICAPQLPEAVELGAAFDVLVVTFIGLALVRAMMTENPLLDIESLRRLRG